jgi:hypothetical protein
VDSTSLNKVFQSHLIPGPYTNQTEFGEFWALRAPKNTNFSTPASFKPPAAEAFYASFYWCTRTFEGITAGPGGVEYVATSSERLTILANDTKIGNGKGNTYAADSTGVRYTIEEATYEGVTMYLNTLLVTEAVDQAVPLAEGAILSTGALLYQQDLGNMTTSIADTMTNIMRSSVLDENYNVTNVAGTAFFNETYIRVSWLWILLPVFETAFVTTLFVLSVVVTSKHPLLKDSVLAYLSTAAKDDVDRPSDLIMTQWTTQAELNGLAADMIVQLEPDDHGQLNFIRKDIVA